MADYYHTCPNCGRSLGINKLDQERMAAPCPFCKQPILVLDFGAQVKKPFHYKCLRCKSDILYENRPPVVRCECGEYFVTSDNGECLIEPELLMKGDKGELPYTKKKDKVVYYKNKWRMMSNGAKAGIFCGIAALAISLGAAYYSSLPEPIENSQAFAQMDSLWVEFREKNPYNLQIEGIRKYEDNSYAMIISEPAERVLQKNLEEFFDKYNCYFTTHRKSIGYDGWLGDVVVAFNDIDDEQIPEMTRKLSSLLYGTDYKAALLDLNTIPEHTDYSADNLNLQITEEELYKWFITDKEPIYNINDSTQFTTIPDAFHDDTSLMGIYTSQSEGFVIWVLKRTNYYDTEDFRLCARQFSLDSDLILGAIADENYVAIIGRERCTPLYVLPPMRQETLCTLANTKEEELAQSYERTSLFAGKAPGGKDFAPIYLSDQLWHTEYGNTLNVTDQMLKSWSENGMIDYVDFGYPKPVDWTFDSGAVADLKVSELTYNWNTAGVGYIVEDDDYSIYAINRTGSLPVSYIPRETDGISDNDPVYQAEQSAYDFFSNLSCPELVKVVQYAAMYQIFRNFGISISADKEIVPEAVVTNPDKFDQCAATLLESLVSFDDELIQKLAAEYDVSIVTRQEYNDRTPSMYGFQIDDNRYAMREAEDIEGLLSLLYVEEKIEALNNIHDKLSPLSGDETLIGCLASSLIDKNANIRYDSMKERLYDSAHKSDLVAFSTKTYVQCIHEAMLELGKNRFLLQEINYLINDITREEIRDLYVETNADKYRHWMKCPTIVESWSLVDSVNQVGGHNLDSKVTSFRVSKELKAGQTRKSIINGREVIEVSPFDRQTHISDPNYLRRIGRLGNADIKGASVAVRPRSTALLGSTRPRSARSFNAKDHLRVEVKAQGYYVEGKKCSFEDMLRKIEHDMAEGSTQTQVIELEGLRGAGVDVNVFMDNVLYSMKKGQSASPRISSFDFTHYSVQTEGDVARITIPMKSGKIEFGNSATMMADNVGVNPKLKLKSGSLVFEVPKSKLQSFLDMLKQFFQKHKDKFWNDSKFQQDMRKFDISVEDCSEKFHYEFAKLFEMYYHQIMKYDVRILQEENVA